jgi:hypothetical protein
MGDSLSISQHNEAHQDPVHQMAEIRELSEGLTAVWNDAYEEGLLMLDHLHPSKEA